ncbi:SHOCT domain-containing protein [Tautonia plasticadhaerens]|uniref:SHOCT domain-containing protein n=1 Tax=Tautonia plasticadhaerens TaxID=2527974 RepID=A0A518GYE8_9BACT|nr:SHOCT domain-containing protein [Tautonia plasticadhaerens]QDV33572.1 hypothetical protein ElP_14460 [Tautonia plasticadhaerens]
MDKLELDARVAKLERRFGLMIVALFIVPAAILLISVARGGRVDVARAATVVSVPTPHPTPTVWETPAPEPFLGGMGGMMGMMGSMEGSMAALSHELATLTQLRDEGVITEEEWQAKKAKILEEPLSPGDLRTDLQLVQQLSDTGAICEEERTALRVRLLGLDEPGGEEMQGY